MVAIVVVAIVVVIVVAWKWHVMVQVWWRRWARGGDDGGGRFPPLEGRVLECGLGRELERALAALERRDHLGVAQVAAMGKSGSAPPQFQSRHRRGGEFAAVVKRRRGRGIGKHRCKC